MSDRLKPVIHNGVERVPSVAICRKEDCRFEWPVAYTPMPLDLWAKLGMKAMCPMCGDNRPLLKGNGDEDKPDVTIEIKA